MRIWLQSIGTAVALLLAGCVHQPLRSERQPIIDMHRHAPWPGDSDAEGIALIRQEMAAHDVVSAMLFITGREDISLYRDDQRSRLVLSPMFPCPALTADRKWCFTDSAGMMPDEQWLDQQLAAGTLAGIGELAFNYAGIHPDAAEMAPFWALAAKYDVPAFIHSGRGPDAGLGPRRHPGCCLAYQPEYGNPALLDPILNRHPGLRIVLQHVGFDFLDETVALMRAHPGVYADMSVLNSVGPRGLHDASLRRLLDAGLVDRIMLGTDDQAYSAVIERIEGADFLTRDQRRGIYYDNAARFLRLDRARIAADYGR